MTWREGRRILAQMGAANDGDIRGCAAHHRVLRGARASATESGRSNASRAGERTQDAWRQLMIDTSASPRRRGGRGSFQPPKGKAMTSMWKLPNCLTLCRYLQRQ